MLARRDFFGCIPNRSRYSTSTVLYATQQGTYDRQKWQAASRQEMRDRIRKDYENRRHKPRQTERSGT